MRRFWFCLGLLVGIALALADGRTTWRMARDLLARTIDALLRFASGASRATPRT